MPRRSAAPRTIGAEDRLRERVREFLTTEERGTSWFARQMQAQGCESFTNMTLTKILSYGRVIYLNEAVAMTSVMNTSLEGSVSDEAGLP